MFVLKKGHHLERQSGQGLHRETARIWQSSNSGRSGDGDGDDTDRQASTVPAAVRDSGADRQGGDVQPHVIKLQQHQDRCQKRWVT